MMLPAESSFVGGKCVDNFRLSPRMSFRWRQHYDESSFDLRTYWIPLHCFRRNKVVLPNKRIFATRESSRQ